MAKQGSKTEKLEILDFYKTHTCTETTIRYDVSGATIQRGKGEFNKDPNKLEGGGGSQAKSTSKKRFSKVEFTDDEIKNMSRGELEELARFHLALKKHSAKSKTEKFFAIHKLSTDYTVDFLCRNLEVSRQGYYLGNKNGMPKHKNYSDEIANKINDIYFRFKCVYGYKMISLLLNKYFHMSIKPWVVYRYMKILGIKAIRKRKKPNYDPSGYLRFPNLLQRNFKANSMYEKGVTDITYISTRDGMRYLSIIRDLFNGEIIDGVISDSPNKDISVRNIVKAWIISDKPKNVIIHSDQGVTYTSELGRSTCLNMKFKISMSRRGNSPDNGACETWFGTFKNECIYTYKTKELSDTNLSIIIKDYIDFYNYIRPIRNQRKTPFEIRTGK